MPRYVVLEHDHPVLHWDLMLEAGATLHTWRLQAPPVGAELQTAVRIGEHRPHYLDYEGPVSGNRGCVRRWADGDFEWVECTEQLIAVRVNGGLTGRLRLERQSDDRWLLRLTPEPCAPNQD